MREIEFRAWYNDGESRTNMFYVGDKFGTNKSMECCAYKMQGQPVTLMQYTGLKDKAGKKIFEGDRLKYELDGEYREFIVKWNDYWAGFTYEDKDTEDNEFPEDWPYPEIIGNIYEGK